MGKKKKGQMPTKIAKGIWEEYANIILEDFAKELELAETRSNVNWAAYKSRVKDIAARMREFKFDFNK